MEQRTNRRGIVENYVKSEHVKLEDLKTKIQISKIENTYLIKDKIPLYPRPEFHVSHLKHDTNEAALQGIRDDGGFKSPFYEPINLVWWSLAVKDEDVAAAETRLLKKTFPDRIDEQAEEQQSFLHKFATSPAFSARSMMGSFRFTFPVEAVLQAYSKQFCSGAEPVMREFETVLYKQEVMYSVLVHPPDQEQFSGLPLLGDDPNAVCAYSDGRFIWRPEAMCETHRYKLIPRPEENLLGIENEWKEFYVWDHVAIALHVEKNEVLHFDDGQLMNNLSFCEKAPAQVSKQVSYQSFDEAEAFFKRLWPESSGSLKREMQLSAEEKHAPGH